VSKRITLFHGQVATKMRNMNITNKVCNGKDWLGLLKVDVNLAIDQRLDVSIRTIDQLVSGS
jgi:hypothetical protein